MAIEDLIYQLGSGQQDTTLRDQRVRESQQQMAQGKEKFGFEMESARQTKQDQDAIDAIQRMSASNKDYAANLRRGGYHEKAQEIEKVDSEYKKNMSTWSKEERIAGNNQSKFMGALMSDVNNQPSYDAALDVFRTKYPDAKIDDDFPEEFQPYFVQMLTTMGKSAHEMVLEDQAAEGLDIKREALDVQREKIEERTARTETKRVTGLRNKISDDDDVINRIQGVIDKVEENPSAIGLRGWAKKQIAKAAGTVGLESVEEWVESEGDIQTEARVNMLTGVLIPYVTGDTSGRYSDKDMERVEEVNEGIKIYTTARRVKATAEELKDIIQQGQINAQRLIDDPDYDVNQPEATSTGKAGDEETKRLERSRSYYMRPK